MKERDIYRALSAYNWGKAAAKGPDALAKRAARVAAYRTLTRLLRKVGL